MACNDIELLSKWPAIMVCSQKLRETSNTSVYISDIHNCEKLRRYKRGLCTPGRSVSPTFFTDSLTRRFSIKTTTSPVVREDTYFERKLLLQRPFTCQMLATTFLFSVTLASIISSTVEGRTIENNISKISRSRRNALPYLASRLMGFGQNLPDSNENFNQFGQFRSGVSQLNSNGAVSPSFPTAPYEGVNLVNNGTGLNIAYQGMAS